ncbi:matrix-remodeling-associated protein 7 isoform X1 [Cricetulus griseus]|uniref:matrix-remodeling-associated protein 7 isoform X1 n=1 Tax=Cricetulus griseus TaxID=10029 RepID=UPI0007DA74C9|nr:matrix-remodeling-associated protein 7 isoform X1 [Cricetulus griseus]
MNNEPFTPSSKPELSRCPRASASEGYKDTLLSKLGRCLVCQDIALTVLEQYGFYIASAESLSSTDPAIVLQDEEQDSDSETGPPTEEPEEEDGAAFSFKYSPGQLRGSQYKKMMTKEELEEEQRVQKEQLAAIFQLMKDNKETFGEMSDCDMQDQLRLYDM